ncbi:PIN domain-containing protein [Streptomyces sp. NPDC002596]
MNSQVTPPLTGAFRLGVFDTSVLTMDILAALDRGEPSSFLAGMQYGTLRGFIPHYVWAEVPRVLADRSREGESFNLRAAEALWWQEYIPVLHVVPTEELPMTPAAHRVALVDPSDAGAAKLVDLLGPVVLLAADRDLIRQDLGPRDWARVRAGLGRLGGAEIKVRATTTVALAAGGGMARLVRLAQANPVAATVIAAAVGIGAHQLRGRISPETREGIERFGKDMARAFGMPFVEHQVHEGSWKAVEYGVPGTDLLSQVARTLARSPEPLPRTAILERLPEPPTEPRRLQMDGLGRLLNRFPAFHETTRGRWQLGRSNMQVNSEPWR